MGILLKKLSGGGTTGTGRTAARLAGVAVAGTLVAGTLAGGAAHAGTGQAGQTGQTGQGVSGAAGKLPRDFLLYEAQARKPVKYPEEEEWTISNRRTENFTLNPCGLRSSVGSGRVSARTITYSAPEFHKSEQLVVFRSAGAAHKAFAGLLAQVAKCDRIDTLPVFKVKAHALDAGDEAARVSAQAYGPDGAPAIGGQRTVVVRKGRALAIYVRAGEYSKVRTSDFRVQAKDARKMAAKVCTLRGVC
ncbi:hypothetical protein [Planobispora takensis]|uniref:PknH-like extracellular domain-containing protein n=1 Tax=Planobispora takensis TaxID=1367882 RepID=A0A8J3T3M1_9ACTN|nr:hypothetical protein [Planobispora takensis]GII05098.1 hypothetical protein Pta02_71060 [Planobispora takensis]